MRTLPFVAVSTSVELSTCAGILDGDRPIPTATESSTVETIIE
ncbi:MAG: hypothetical protein V5A45_08015 [Haloarculaceae archaeon]